MKSKILKHDYLVESLKTTPVSVKVIEIEWLANSLRDLYKYLEQVDDNNLFGNEFIKLLLE